MKIEMPQRVPLRKSARRIFADISNVNTLLWIGVAFLIHVVVIGALSVDYIRDRLDPAGAQARAAAEAKNGQTPGGAPAAPATSRSCDSTRWTAG